MPEHVSSETFDNQMPTLTVVVCTYNRIELLPASLHALMLQTIRNEIQVVVVDDGSTQDTASVVAGFDVEYVPLAKNEGLSFARNVGVDRALAPIVAFTDDDVVVPPDWCESLLKAWREAPDETRAIGGTVTVSEPSSFNQRYLACHNPLAPIELDVAHAKSFYDRLRAYLNSESTREQVIRPVYSLVGANMSFDRDALLKVGGFDPSIRFGGDEEYVCVNLRERFGDQAILCYSSIVVAHTFDQLLRDTFRRAYLYGSSNGRSWSRNGGVPGLRPVGGLFTVSLALLAPFSFFGAAVVSLFFPFAMWRRWVGASFRDHKPEMVLYPLIALTQELCSNFGFVAGWHAERGRDH